jgi:multiple sugar transport system permease protein
MVFLLLTLSPLLLSMAVFLFYPVARGVWGSFTLWQGFQAEAPFVGVRHYTRALNDEVFRIALRNTFYYTLLTVPTGLGLSLLLALLIEASGGLRTFFRAAYFLPVVTSTIATALLWKWFYQPSLGLFNQLLSLVGFPGFRWLLSTTQAMPSIALYATWKGVGFSMVIFMAGLTTIPAVYRDAAKVDGANRWQVFWQITLPLLQPTLVFTLVTGVIGSLQVFGPIFVMTSTGSDPPGGPSNATMTVAVLQWLVAFRQVELGYGSAMAVILFAIMLALTLLQLRLLRMRWEY